MTPQGESHGASRDLHSWYVIPDRGSVSVLRERWSALLSSSERHFRNAVVFLPKEPYLGTCKHSSILKVLRNENKDTIDEYRCQVFQLGEGVYPPTQAPNKERFSSP